MENSFVRKKTSFHHLPNELVVKVFSYSNELPLLFTCKRYYYLVNYPSKQQFHKDYIYE